MAEKLTISVKKFGLTYNYSYIWQLEMKIMQQYFKKYYQSLCYFAMNITRDKELSKDIVQNVFVTIVAQKIEFETESHFKQYAYSAVRNQCVSNLRSSVNDRIVSISDMPELEIYADDECDTEIVRAELIRMINEAIESLPPRYRDVFRMAYIERMKSEEIAEALGISVNTVKVIRQRARTRLREQLKDFFPVLLLLIDRLATMTAEVG